MSPADFNHTSAHDYDLRSLQHERRMLAQYRRMASHDDATLQPLANACWRAACFEWRMSRDAETVRRLMGESARALAQGFSRRHFGFDPNPEQFILALHLSIAARERDAFTALAMSEPNLRSGILRDARAFRTSRMHFHLAEGYALVSRALVERTPLPARAAVETLAAARAESEREWWERQFPDAFDAAWRIHEHDAICLLLGAVARRIADITTSGLAPSPDTDEELTEEFTRVIDEALLRLETFVEEDENHHPKLYLWLPGLALCALAHSAGLPMHWLQERHEAQAAGYSRLPPELLRRTPNPTA